MSRILGEPKRSVLHRLHSGAALPYGNLHDRRDHPQRGLVVAVQAERAARIHQQTLRALGDIVGGVGLSHPRDLQPHHLVRRLGATHLNWIDRIYPFLPERSLQDASEDTDYADWWRAASAKSFAPQIDLVPQRASKSRVIASTS